MKETTEFNFHGVQLRYNPETGECWRRLKAGGWKLIKPGTEAGVVSKGKISYLGLFTTPEDAALAYDKAANELHGEFARLNFSTGSC